MTAKTRERANPFTTPQIKSRYEYRKQSSVIARALAIEPNIIFLDEPTSALDVEMVREVLDVVKELAGSGMNMLAVTHEMRFAREAADRIVLLDEGQIVEDRAP